MRNLRRDRATGKRYANDIHWRRPINVTRSPDELERVRPALRTTPKRHDLPSVVDFGYAFHGSTFPACRSSGEAILIGIVVWSRTRSRATSVEHHLISFGG
jgi:hypothetical protein